ncbi:MAG: helix-turn-helix transcriptional regulator [Firmicutes bacterium]|nr:helix-turn-helix transcriptional regulator [Bacillota bacterium]
MRNQINVRFEEFLRRRIEKGLTLNELARRSKISSPFMSQIDRGTRHPGPKTAMKLAKALDCRFEDIFYT